MGNRVKSLVRNRNSFPGLKVLIGLQEGDTIGTDSAGTSISEESVWPVVDPVMCSNLGKLVID